MQEVIVSLLIVSFIAVQYADTNTHKRNVTLAHKSAHRDTTIVEVNEKPVEVIVEDNAEIVEEKYINQPL